MPWCGRQPPTACRSRQLQRAPCLGASHSSFLLVSATLWVDEGSQILAEPGAALLARRLQAGDLVWTSQFCCSHPVFIPRVSPGKVPSPSRGACPGFGSALCSPEPGDAPLPPHLSCAAQSEQAVRLSQCFLIKALGVV